MSSIKSILVSTIARLRFPICRNLLCLYECPNSRGYLFLCLLAVSLSLFTVKVPNCVFFGNAALSFPLIFPRESFLTQAVSEAALTLL